MIIFISLILVVALAIAMLCNRRINNWLMFGVWILTFGLLINAIYQGGGEPLGLTALKEIARPEESDPIMKYYLGEHYLGLPPTEKPNGTWIWWQLWAVWQGASLVLPLCAFWDEIAAERNERRMRRQRVINLRPPEPTPPAPIPHGEQTATKTLPKILRPIWSKFLGRLSAILPAEMISEAAIKAAGQIWRRR